MNIQGLNFYKKVIIKVKNKLKFYKRVYLYRKEFLQLIHMYKDYLENGRYRIRILVGSKVVAFLNDDKSLEFCKNNSILSLKKAKNIVLKTCNFFDNIFIHIIANAGNKITLEDIHKKEACGSILMLTANKNVKIFSLNEKTVLTFYSKSQNYKTTKTAVSIFSEYFSLTTIGFNDNKYMCCEKNINFKSCDKWTRDDAQRAINEIFTGYYNYFKKIAHENHAIFSVEKTMTHIENQAAFPANVLNTIKKIINNYKINENMPCIFLHGDMAISNILLSDECCYFIDWESSKNLIFFCDFFMPMINYKSDKNDSFFITKYFQGYYDSCFDKIFNLFSIKYEHEKKMYYIVLYIIQHMAINVENLPNDKILLYADRTLQLLTLCETIQYSEKTII